MTMKIRIVVTVTVLSVYRCQAQSQVPCVFSLILPAQKHSLKWVWDAPCSPDKEINVPSASSKARVLYHHTR